MCCTEIESERARERESERERERGRVREQERESERERERERARAREREREREERDLVTADIRGSECARTREIVPCLARPILEFSDNVASTVFLRELVTVLAIACTCACCVCGKDDVSVVRAVGTVISE